MATVRLWRICCKPENPLEPGKQNESAREKTRPTRFDKENRLAVAARTKRPATLKFPRIRIVIGRIRGAKVRRLRIGARAEKT